MAFLDAAELKEIGVDATDTDTNEMVARTIMYVLQWWPSTPLAGRWQAEAECTDYVAGQFKLFSAQLGMLRRIRYRFTAGLVARRVIGTILDRYYADSKKSEELLGLLRSF